MENGGAAAKSGGQGAASSWDIWELGNWSSAAIAAAQSSSTSYNPHAIASSSSSPCPPFADHAAAVPTAPGDHRVQGHQYGLHHHHHHLTCLKLGKRPYYGEEGLAGGGIKRERPSPNRAASAAAAAAVPRCQVEGCNKALVDAKDYHKRHKVCEMHSKAPKVVVLGAEQRFCQQCSRFHAISEFDDSKRSCRRRLAGHNERRRKSTNDSIRNSSLENTMVGSRFPYMPTSPGRALSLLSSKASPPWVSTSELSSRSSAALRELIAENRAAVLARQVFSSDRGGWHNMGSENQANLSYVQHQHQVPWQPQAQLADGWNQFPEAGNHVTLDLMQMPGSSFEILSGRRKSKEEEEECCEIWKSLEGTHVV